MIFQKKKTIELLDKFLLTVPTKLKHHQDELSNTEALFITDRLESFVISFEKGMADMTKPEKDEDAKNTLEYEEDGKYIRFRRSVPDASNNTGGYAFFSIELDCHGKKLQLNGQMTAKPGYKWSDSIEPTMITILRGIRIKS
ncbi:MAG: hypothetical protein E7473_12310 [Ruminococcaceae bacterium]|nr:hypothetical protein [Oscillospiraceae bacterium]